MMLPSTIPTTFKYHRDSYLVEWLKHNNHFQDVLCSNLTYAVTISQLLTCLTLNRLLVKSDKTIFLEYANSSKEDY